MRVEKQKINSPEVFSENETKIAKSDAQLNPSGNLAAQKEFSNSISASAIQEKPSPSFSKNLQKNFDFNKYAKFQSNLSYLKVIAILLVVLTHTMRDLYQANSSLIDLTQVAGHPNSVNPWIFMFLQILSITCVNIFVSVSCFLENRSMKVKFFKFIKLYLIITLILCVTQAMEWIIASIIGGGGTQWTQVSPTSWQNWLKCFIWFYYEDPWYFTAYFAFLLIVPFVNLLYSKLSLNGKNVAFGIVILIFVVWKILYLGFSNAPGFTGATSVTSNSPLFGTTIPGITDNILGRGYNFLNFFVIYAIIQWIIAHDFFKRFKKGWLPLFVFAFALMYILSIWVPNGNINAFMYSNPLVILMSICLLGAFLNLKCKNRKWINYLSTLTMYVFVCHWNPLGQVFIYNYFKPALNNVFWGSDGGLYGAYTGSANFMGWFVAPQDTWVLCLLLWWIILSTALFIISMCVDSIFKLCTAIPAWQQMINWMKSVTKLDKFENIVEGIKDKKEEDKKPTLNSSGKTLENRSEKNKQNIKVSDLDKISESIDEIIEEKIKK